MSDYETQHPTTDQVWPCGGMVTWLGDPFRDTPPMIRRAVADPVEGQPETWSLATPKEHRAIRVHLRAKRIADREIYRCQSSLIDDLARLGGSGEGGDLGEAFAPEEWQNVYQNPEDWDAERCREYLEGQGVDLPEVPEIECPACKGDGEATGDAADGPCPDCKGTGYVPDPDADEDDSPGGYLTELRDAVREHAQENPAEPYEWYAVSPWLCARLAEAGEVVIDNHYGEWWGRCATGQNLIMDGILQQIAGAVEGPEPDEAPEAEEVTDARS